MWKSIIKFAEELFFPQQCFFCKKYGTMLCGDCQTLLDISPLHRPDRSQKYLSDIFTPCSYENNYAKKLIHGFKYEPFHKKLALPLAGLIAAHFKLAEQNCNIQEFIIVPVPLAPNRVRWRGFNQAETLASELAKIWQLNVETSCLKRTRETKAQAELSQNQRRENIKNAFTCEKPAPIKNKSIFLVDDVVTTGATMNECARVLSKNGAQKIIGISIARTENS